MTENVASAAEHIAADLSALRQDVARLAEAMNKLLQHQTQGVGIRVSEAVGDATGRIENRAANAQNRVRAAGRSFEAGIERNPFTAVLISFGAGISIGLLSRLRG